MADEIRLNIRADGLKETIAGITTLEEATKKRNELRVDITAAKQNIAELRRQLELALSYHNFRLSGSLKQEIVEAEQEVKRLSQEYQTVNLAIIKAQAEQSRLAEETKKSADAAQDDWKARAEAVKEAIRSAGETAKQRKEAEEAARIEKYRALEAETTARAQAKAAEESRKSAAAANDDWKARAEATKEAIRTAAETAKQRAEAEKAAQEAERAAKAAEAEQYATYYASLEERNKAEAAKQAADEISRQEEAARRTAAEEATAALEAERMAAAAEQAEARFQAVLNVVEGIASALDIASSGVGLIGNFADSIFHAFEATSNMFSFNFIDKAVDTITSMITQNLVGNMDRITARFDIMNTFDEYMRLMGVSQEDADKAIQRINDSILGLPIGLDEAMYRLRRYQMFTGDINQATDFTIGLQRAIIAGGASESMRNQAYNQIERLLSTGELNTKRQWISLLTGLGVSSQFIAEQLGYQGWGGKELAAALYSNQISSSEFLGAIAELGKGQSEAAARLSQAIEIYKRTTESWQSSIEYAFIRGGEQTLETINRMLVVETETNLVGYMKKFRDAVDAAFKDARNWLDANPQQFSTNIKSISDLLTALSKFNVGNIAGKGLSYISEFIESITGALDELDHDKVESFIAFGTTIAGPIAALSKAAGPMGVLMGVAERFEGHDWGNFFELVAGNINDIASVVFNILDRMSDSTLDRILAFGVTYVPLLTTVLSHAATAVRNFGKAIEWLGNHNAWSKLQSLFGYSNFDLSKTFLGASGSAWAGANSVLVSGTLAGGLLLAAEGFKAFHEGQAQFIEDNEALVTSVDRIVSATKDLHSSVDDAIASKDESIGYAAEKGAMLGDLLEKIAKLDATVERSGNENVALELKTYVDLVNEAFPEMALKINEASGALDTHSKRILANRDAYIELLTVMAQYDAAQGVLSDLYSKKIQLALEGKQIESAQADAEALYMQYLNDERYPGANPSGNFLLDLLDEIVDSFNLSFLGEVDEAHNSYSALLQAGEQNASDMEALNREIADVYEMLISFGKQATEIGNRTVTYVEDGTALVGKFATELFSAVESGEKVGKTTTTLAAMAGVTLPGQRFPDTPAGAAAEIAYAMEVASAATEDAAKSTETYDFALEELEETAEEVAETIEHTFSIPGIMMGQAFDYVAQQLDSIITAFQLYDLELNAIIGTYAEFKDSTKESLDMMISGLGELAKIEPINLYNKITGQKNNINNLTQLQDSLGKVLEYLYDNRGILDEYESNLWQTFLNDPYAHANEIVGLANALGTANYQTIMSNLGVEDTLTDGVSQMAAEAFNILTQGLQNTMIATKANGDESQYAEDFMGEFIKARGEVIKSFVKGITMDGMMTDSGAEEDVTDRLDEIRQKFFGEDEESVGGSVGLLNKLLIELYTDTYEGLEDGTNQLAGVLDDFNQNHLKEIIDAYDQATQNADELGQQAVDTGTEMSGQAETYSAFAGVIGEVGSAAAEAAQAISGLMNAIAGVSSMPLTIPTVSAPISYAGANTEQPFATGGVVDGVYRGYDSVHALLTPGEFVVRRRVAQVLGRNFLENLNSMNIPAAVDSLMRSANLPQSRIVAYDNRRTYDNHAQVIQNINTNNAAFTYRRASRFVGAL